jgi:phospholipase C
MNHRKIAARLSSLAAVAASLGACSAATPNTSGNTLVECRPLTTDAAVRPAAWSGTVFTIVMENHDSGQIFGSSDAPFLNGLAAQGAVAAGYHDSYVHPSEPNYIWMVAGENFGILNDDDPGPTNTIGSQSHLADQIEAGGLRWRAYEESMGAPCGLVSHDNYAVKHNPFAYFSDINGWNGTTFAPPPRCAEHLVDYSQLAVDIAANDVPDYVFITPNLDDDMHNGTVAEGDAWLASEVPKILATDAYKNGGALFVLWDEGSNSGDDPPFIAISPNTRAGAVSPTAYDTSSFLLTVEDMLGVDPLPCAATPASVQPMSDLFTSPL